MPAVTTSETRHGRRHHRASPKPPGVPWPPDVTASNWSEQPCFSRYWQHYHSVMSWSRLQNRYYRQANDFYHRSQRFLAQSQQPSSVFHNQENSRPGHSDRPRQQSRGHENEDEDEDTDDCDDIDTDSEQASDDFEMEITNEMLEFFTKSHQHRLERDAARASDDSGDKKEQKRIDLATASVQKTKSDVTTHAPKERPGVRRTAEMKKLYGKNAAMIHGMETALQMTFDRNCDILQPTLWPIMPFNIQFEQKD